MRRFAGRARWTCSAVSKEVYVLTCIPKIRKSNVFPTMNRELTTAAIPVADRPAAGDKDGLGAPPFDPEFLANVHPSRIWLAIRVYTTRAPLPLYPGRRAGSSRPR